jgi:acyl carrier protein
MSVHPLNPAAAPPHEDVVAGLSRYVADTFLDGDATSLTPDSPLLEWGVLTSMNTAQLLTHVRERFGVDVPPQAITAKHLRDLNAISALVRRLIAAPAT